MVIILLPQGLTNLDLKINTPNHMKEKKFSVRVVMEEISNPMGKGKEIAIELHQPLKSMIISYIV